MTHVFNLPSARRIAALSALVIFCLAGCATLSGAGDLGPKYEPDKVDELNAQTKRINEKVKSIGDEIAKLRKRIGGVVKGEVELESFEDEAKRLKKSVLEMVGVVKEMPSRAKKLLLTAKDLLVEAPKKYLGTQALHLPKKVDLLKESIEELKKVPSTAKGILDEGLALGKCVAGLAQGSAAECGTEAKVASGSSVGKEGGADGKQGESSKAGAGGDNTPGGLLIKSEPPGATATLDGKWVKGKTPLTVRNLPPGEHTLEIRNGVYVHTGKVHVAPGKYETVEIQLKKATARLEVLSTPPEASIILDGVPVGDTPKIISPVVAGKHQLEVRKAGYLAVKQEISIRRLQKLVKVQLRRGGTISIASTPTQAVAAVDGKRQGTTPLKVTLRPGRHRIELTKPGYISAERRLTVEVGKTGNVSVVLELTEEEKLRLATIEAAKEKAARDAEETRRRREAEARLLAALKAKQRAEAEARLRVVAEAQRRAIAAANAQYKAALDAHGRAMAPVRKKRRSKSIWGYTALGVGGALATTSAILLGVGKNRGDSAHADYMAVSDFHQPTLDSYRDEIDGARTTMIVGGIMMGVAAGCIGYSLYEIFTRPGLKEQPSRKDFFTDVALEALITPERDG